MPSATLDDAIMSRMSTRAFVPQAVPADTITGLLGTAARLVWGSKSPPWSVHVLQGESRTSLCEKVCAAHEAARAAASSLAREREDYDYYPEKWASPYLDRRRENGWGLYGLLGIGKTDKDKMHVQHQRNYRFFDAPVGLIFTMHRAWGTSALMHYGMFLQNIMIAARGHGLHTCPQAAWNNFASIILPHVGASADELLVCGMSLGYADEAATVNSFYTPRLPVPEFARWIDTS